MRVLVAVLALLLVVLCAPAGAATVSYTAGSTEPPGTPPEESCSRYMQCPVASLTFQAAPGEANAVSVAAGAGTLVFRDGGAPLTAGPGCTGQLDGSVTCPSAPATVLLADGNDRVQSSTPLMAVRGGDGSDVIAGGRELEGGAGDDTLDGGPEAERLLPGSGSDVVAGGGGDDVLIDAGGVEADQLDGGEGNDELQFLERDEPVRADLGARPQQAGSEGEGNTVAGIERVVGGRGPDVLLSDPAAPATPLPVLSGIDGDDRLEIRGVGAAVNGGTGGDEIVGGAGDDTITGGLGADELTGGGGNDLINGDAAGDTIDGGDGRDIVLAGDGADRVSGGAGDDRVSGGIGGDILRGDRGRDFLNGGGGNDQLFGGSGRDELLGDSGRDVLRGDTDADRLVGGIGPDRVLGGAGRDVVSVADRSRDRVDCGTGRDRVTLDRRDRSTRCERRRRR